MRLYSVLLILVTGLLAAVPPAGAAGTGEPRMGAHGLILPASFTGTLPCADCPGVAHHLDLWPDQVFHLRREWLGRDLATAAIGRWHADPSRQAIMLVDRSGTVAEFEVEGTDRVRLLAQDGTPIVSDLPYELASEGTLDPAEIALPLRGVLTYFADAASFRECLTGRVSPVAFEGDWIAAERALVESGRNVDGDFASFDGRLAQRPRMEGEGTLTTAIVERFVALWPDLTCERAKADAPLVNTYWKLVRLGAEPIAATGAMEEARQEPHILLRADEPRFAATVGCNRLMGGFEAGDGSLSFGPAAMSMMACPPPLDRLEQDFAAMLGTVAAYRIAGPAMELLDSGGAPLALFEAVYLP